ncbi:hypothetical protein F4810DRAFT_671309 [Camillea tinctor]|nr:hypothetical protein F4810DRAFT_671309 [Camillea tinctor]
MSPLLQFPREIRDSIIKWVSLLPSVVPPDPSTLSLDDRVPLYKDKLKLRCLFDHIMVQKQQKTLSLLPLMLVNRQLYSEAKEILQLLSRSGELPDYKLDIVYLKNCTFWPTWISLPWPSPVVETLYVQFRIFGSVDQFKEMKMSYQEHPSSVSESVGLDRLPILWIFYSILVHTLGHESPVLGVEPGEELMARRVVLDFLPTDGDLRPLGEYSTAQDPRKVELFRMDENWQPKSAELAAPEMLLNYVYKMLYYALSMIYKRYPHGRALYAHVGELEMRLDGEFVANLRIPDMFRSIPYNIMLGSRNREETENEFFKWKEVAAVKRREAGFPESKVDEKD